MAYAPSTDFLIEVEKGNVPGHSLVHKFGHNTAVGTTLVPVSLGGIYRTPQIGGATALRVKAGDINDAAGGTGAREIMLEGLDTSGVLLNQTLVTAGALASADTPTDFLRLFRFFVSASGTYATVSIGSHAADIVIENAAGTEDWGIITALKFPTSQTEIAAFSVPIGFTAFIISTHIFSDSTKITRVFFFQRSNILQIVPPYDAMRLIFDATVEGGSSPIRPKAPIRGIVGPSDLVAMAFVNQGTASVHVDMEILLVADD